MFTHSKFFKKRIINIGNWNLYTAKSFSREKFLAADTETKLYYKNELLDEETAYNLYKENGQKWFKMNVEVRAYAFMISNGENFALFEDIEDFLTCISMMGTKVVFWYNAKFDFSIFDYYFLTNGWKNSIDITKDLKHYGKLPDKTYHSLNGEFGQRYQYRIWKKYLNCNSVEKVHNFKMIDICNIFGGGLKKNLEDWDIEDKQGYKVRKLEMDYVNADLEQDIQYLINDTKGLYLLAEKINKTLFDITGFSLFKLDYLTAGGLAKKTLLKYMFGQSNMENIRLFKECFPLTPEEDKEFRINGLYKGGKCIVNPYKKGKIQYNIYKYDVNSMYPDKMRNMLYPIGDYEKIIKEEEKQGYIYIYKLKSFVGFLKRDKIPVFQSSFNDEYEEFIDEEEFYIWKEELEELKNWYELDYEIDYILKYKAMKCIGAQKYVDTFYDIKCNSKGCIKQGAKLLLNSAYGKLAQRVERVNCQFSLVENTYVHIERLDTEVDESSMLNVVVGSRVTALARVALMEFMRKICNENVKDNFIYCDTDSVHALTEFLDTDEKKLGYMKNEGTFKCGMYLAPKSYVLYDGEKYEVHTKGVNTKVVKDTILNECKEFKDILKVFIPNRLFKCLSALNVRGGKALVYIDKMIVNDEKLAKQIKFDYDEDLQEYEIANLI